MSREQFINWKPSKKSEEILILVDNILNEYKSQGYRLTLRQLYYQLVSRDAISNNTREYKKLGSIVNNGRLAGLIDWDMIEDRMRTTSTNPHWDSPADIVKTAARSFYRSRWEKQDYYIEVWCEKDAVSNIIQPVCHKWDVPFMANRGYSSQSAMYKAYERYRGAYFEKKKLSLIYLGDHDPSGIDMTRDIQERMELFLGYRELVAEVNIPLDVHRIALNMNQVQQYNPPENPAKMTDSRFEGYALQYGTSSWELDALEPSVLSTLLTTEIEKYIDWDLWKQVEEQEEKEREQINKLIELL